MRRRGRTCCTAVGISYGCAIAREATHQCLNVEEEHADGVVARPVERKEVDKSVDRRGERTVQPTTTLTDELSSLLRHIRLSLRRLDIGQGPLVALLRDEFETEDTILGQEHVLREDVHAVDTLLPETVRERVVTVEVLLERASEDRAVAIRREGTRQHRHVAEAGL